MVSNAVWSRLVRRPLALVLRGLDDNDMHTGPLNGLWDRLRVLPLRIDGYRLKPLQLDTNSGFTRETTVVQLEGDGQVGSGEDVIWDGPTQAKFRERGPHLPLAGAHTLGEFSALLDQLELTPDPPPVADNAIYRRWAFESAALDLALRQSGLGIEGALGLTAGPLHFGVSLGLHDFDAIERRLALHPNMRFKLDATPSWSVELCEALAATAAVDVVDFKGAYKGTIVDVAPDLSLYERVLDAMPNVIVEDPHDDTAIHALLRDRGARIAFDAPIHCFADIAEQGLESSSVNIKPSRFGTLRALLDAYERCGSQGLSMYGGGQFELGVGREQIQVLAALFHADGPNDVAPGGYHRLDSDEPRPASPLRIELPRAGFALR